MFECARITNKMIVDAPLKTNVRYFTTNGVPLSDLSLYHTIVGTLVYLNFTYPDIAYVVRVVSQFITAPTIINWGVVPRILRYLHGTQFHSLLVL